LGLTYLGDGFPHSVDIHSVGDASNKGIEQCQRDRVTLGPRPTNFQWAPSSSRDRTAFPPPHTHTHTFRPAPFYGPAPRTDGNKPLHLMHSPEPREDGAEDPASYIVPWRLVTDFLHPATDTPRFSHTSRKYNIIGDLPAAFGI
jgi:hypothetical protein